MGRQEPWIKITKKLKHSCNNLSLPQLPPTIPPYQSNNRFIISKGDSAASAHYFTEADSKVLQNVKKDVNPTTVLLPNNSTMQSLFRKVT